MQDPEFEANLGYITRLCHKAQEAGDVARGRALVWHVPVSL